MKVPGITSTAILGLLLGMAAPVYAQPVYAQHDQQGETQDHPQQQQNLRMNEQNLNSRYLTAGIAISISF